MTALETIAAARESIERSRKRQIDMRRNNPKARTIPQEIGYAIRKKLEDIEWEKLLASQVDAKAEKKREAMKRWKEKNRKRGP